MAFGIEPNWASDHREYYAAQYQFQSPCRLTVRATDGTVSMIGYGIGDVVEVMDPRVETLSTRRVPLKEIPLTDGSVILDWAEQAEIKRLPRPTNRAALVAYKNGCLDMLRARGQGDALEDAIIDRLDTLWWNEMTQADHDEANAWSATVCKSWFDDAGSVLPEKLPTKNYIE